MRKARFGAVAVGVVALVGAVVLGTRPVAEETSVPSATTVPSSVVASGLIGTDWVLQSVSAPASRPRPSPAGWPVTIEFTAHYLAFDTPCFGELHGASQQGSDLTVGPMIVTDVHGCPSGDFGPGPDLLRRFVNAPGPIEVRRDGSALVLSSPQGTFRFADAGPARLSAYYPQLRG